MTGRIGSPPRTPTKTRWGGGDTLQKTPTHPHNKTFIETSQILWVCRLARGDLSGHALTTRQGWLRDITRPHSAI